MFTQIKIIILISYRTSVLFVVVVVVVFSLGKDCHCHSYQHSRKLEYKILNYKVAAWTCVSFQRYLFVITIFMWHDSVSNDLAKILL